MYKSAADSSHQHTHSRAAATREVVQTKSQPEKSDAVESAELQMKADTGMASMSSSGSNSNLQRKAGLITTAATQNKILAAKPAVQLRTIQAKLTLGQPNDAFEQEADHIASQIVQNYTQAAALQQKCASIGLPLGIQPKCIQARIMRRVQPSVLKRVLQPKCEHCQQEENKIQPKFIQRQGSGDVVSSSIEAQIQASQGQGSPMDRQTQGFMESSFGSDFSSVRIHTGSQAVQMSKDLNAHAFTVGSDIFFNQGQYQPGNTSGANLLAHELTHVVQQGAAVQRKQDADVSYSYGALLSDTAVQAKLSQSGNAHTNAALFRKEISDFQQANPRTDLLAQQQVLQSANQVQLKDQSKTLRRCGGGTTAPPPAAVAQPTFTVSAFSAGSGGPITATPDGAGTSVRIDSASYNTSGTVDISGSTDAEAKDWQIGYIQTAHALERKGHYTGGTGPGAQIMAKWSIPNALRDANEAGGEPWYDPSNKWGNGPVTVTKTSSSVNVSLGDRPGSPHSWDAADGKGGKLNTHDGKDSFTAWIIARKKSSPNTIQYLKWATWEVDYGVSFNYASKGAKTVAGITGKTQNTGSGNGQGSTTPILNGATANNSFTLTWS